ncbi:F-box protein SKIP23 [Rhynchospora pubera]|uniref:F-box protein SKIP23 n=1 Tax=Rhynchospora pubera TaxID=906938 RepID=A0AAV8DTN0_9POAL|nr:F-box protein SKIP23 [Rhynchospora pubera]
MEAMNEGEEDRNWACLPPDVLNVIAKCLNEISDFIKFRVVCHAWRSSTPITDLPAQFPLILDSPNYSRDPNLRFYSLSFNKTYTIPSPRALDKKYSSGPSSNGYMATLSKRNFRPVSLLNPLTNHEIYLPACPSVCDHHWIGSSQNQMGEYVILCYGRLCFHRTRLVFWHPGQRKWHRLKLGSAYKNCCHFYIRDMLFSIKRSTGVTKVTSITNGATTLLYDVPPPFEGYPYSAKCYYEYLVEDSLGDILRVSYDLEDELHIVYRLDVGYKNGSSPCWVQVSDIGNQAIFIDVHGAFMLRAGELSGIKKNSIYHLKKPRWETPIPISYYRPKRIDIDTYKIELLPCPLKYPSNWILPNLHHL